MEELGERTHREGTTVAPPKLTLPTNRYVVPAGKEQTTPCILLSARQGRAPEPTNVGGAEASNPTKWPQASLDRGTKSSSACVRGSRSGGVSSSSAAKSTLRSMGPALEMTGLFACSMSRKALMPTLASLFPDLPVGIHRVLVASQLPREPDVSRRSANSSLILSPRALRTEHKAITVKVPTSLD